MSAESNATKICPTCGTRLNASATKCTVCGSSLASSATNSKPVQPTRMPEITLSLPAVLGLVVLLLAVGAGAVFAVYQTTQPPSPEALVPTGTPTLTATITPTLADTATPTLEPTTTPLPTLEYIVALGDDCNYIAWLHDVSVNSIITMNRLPTTCDTLYPGQVLHIPQPTATLAPTATATMNPTEQAQASCEKLDYIVTSTDTLSSVALNYGVTVASIRAYSGLPGDTIYPGQLLKIPLCEQGPQATRTATPIPPYAAANLLLPADGSAFTANDVITLQWASVGELRTNEAYAVTILDATNSDRGKHVEYVTDTKFIVPETLRPTDTSLHIFRWSILVVRQTGSDADSGAAIWEPAGAVSAERVFGWTGGPVASTPQP